jgi:hypothetical protein
MLHLSLAPVAIVLSLVGAGAPGSGPIRVAQRPQPASEVRPPRVDPFADRARASGSSKRERLREKIRAMRGWYLTKELDLDAATAGRLFAILDRYDDSIDALQKKGSRLRRLLRQEMGRPRPDRRAIERHVDDLVAHYDEMYQVQRERFAAVRKVVTAEQGAKLLLLLPKIDSAIRRQISKVMRKAKRKGRDRPARRGRDEDRDPDATRPLDPFQGRESGSRMRGGGAQR